MLDEATPLVAESASDVADAAANSRTPAEASGSGVDTSTAAVQLRPFATSAARRLLASNALDAASRNAMDFAVDATAVLLVSASALEIGILNAAGTISFMLLGIPIGVWVDRTDARKAMILAATARGIVSGLLALTLFSGHATFGVLIVASVLIGIASTISETGQTVRATQVVPEAVVGTLVARLESADRVSSLVAPAAAGIALGLIGAPWLVSIAAISSLAAAGVLVSRRSSGRITRPVLGAGNAVNESQKEIPASQQPTKQSGLAHFVAELREGIAAFRGDTLLRRLTWKTSLTNLALAAFSAVQTILMLRILGLGIEVFGVLITVAAGGGLAGSVLAEPLFRRYTRIKTVFLTTAALSIISLLPLVAVYWHGWAIPALAAHAFLWGLFIVIGNIQAAAIVAERVPSEVLGRVSALRRTLTYGIVPIGSILGGLLGDKFGVTAVLIATLLLTAAATVITASIRDNNTDRHCLSAG